jgi:hypothetical protein
LLTLMQEDDNCSPGKLELEEPVKWINLSIS